MEQAKILKLLGVDKRGVQFEENYAIPADVDVAATANEDGTMKVHVSKGELQISNDRVEEFFISWEDA